MPVYYIKEHVIIEKADCQEGGFMGRKKKSFIDIDDQLIVADLLSETIGGGTNAVCALGNNSLTVGISPWGEVTYLRWPTPSYYDHLRYVTKSKPLFIGILNVSDVRYGNDAPCEDWKKYGRPYEKYPGTGSRAGLYAASSGMLWLDDPVWNSSREYVPRWSQMLKTTLSANENNPLPSVSMDIEQWIMPDRDLLVQQYSIHDETIESLFYHATYAPWETNQNTIHNPDSKKAGFAAVYCHEEDVMVWFYPRPADRKKVRGGLPGVRSCGDLDRLCPGGGIFIVMGAGSKIEQYQVGADRAGRWTSWTSPEGGRSDAGDGSLRGRPFYVGHVDAAVKTGIAKGEAGAVLYTSIAGSAKDAVRIIVDARKTGVEGLRDQAMTTWKQRYDEIFIPGMAGESEQQVGKRAVINLLNGRDEKTGAMIASPARQPCYACDWPRDGAFYDMALDLAGYGEMVDRHLDFYRRTQRKNRCAFHYTWLASLRLPFYNPRGHWFANMNTDGTPGFFKIIPLEIDETSLMVWDLWRHYLYVPENARDNFSEAYREMLIMAMEAIMPYVDLKKGWTRKIMEDDDQMVKATLHGASAVLTALASGADLAQKWQLGREYRERWGRAALALREGMRERIRDPRVLDSAGWRGIQWSLFPSPLFDHFHDPLCTPFIERLEENMKQKAIKQQGGVGYLGEQLFIFALATRAMPEYREYVRQVLSVLVNDVPVEGTDCYGELGLWVTMNGKRFIQNRTSIPHIWNGVTAYLAVLAVYQPELLQPLVPPVPKL